MTRTVRKTASKKATKRTRKFSDGVYQFHGQYHDSIVSGVVVKDLRNKGWKVRTTKGKDTLAFGYMNVDEPRLVWKRSNKRRKVAKVRKGR